MIANSTASFSKPHGFHWFWVGIFGKNSSANFLVVPIVLLFLLFSVAVIRSPNLVGSAGLGSALIVVAPLILATYALTLIVMAGRGGVDLSIGPLIGFINVTLVVLFEKGYLTSWLGFFVYAIGVGMLYQFILAMIIIFIRIQPIIVSLSGFLTLSGLNLIILRRPGGTVPEWMQWWGSGVSIWTPVLVIILIVTLLWFFFKKTAFFTHLRMMGSDERTAYTAGVNINIVRLGAHLMAGVCAALAAISFTSLIGSGDPTQGSTYTLISVTAMVLGGTSLAGGRGTFVGSLLGAINIYLINYVLSTFNFGKVQSYITQLSYGGILVLALMLTLFLPNIQKLIRNISPVLLFIFLGLIACSVVLFSFDLRTAKTFQSTNVGIVSGDGIQSLGGDDSGIQSLGGDDSGIQSLGGDDSGIQSLGGEETAEKNTSPKGTPVIIGLVILAVIFFLVYLLYRFFSFATFLFIGSIGLLTLGYGVYDKTGSSSAVERVMIKSQSIFTHIRTQSPGIETSVVDIGWITIGFAVLTSLLLGTILSFMTIKKIRTSISNRGILSVALAGAVITGLIAYGGRSWNQQNANEYGSILLGLFVIGGLIFSLTMPKFSKQLPKFTETILSLFCLVLLGAMFFLGVAPNSSQTKNASIAEPIRPSVAALIDKTEFSPLFTSMVVWLLVMSAILFLLTLKGVRKFLQRNIAFNKLPADAAYTMIFIAVVSGGLLGWIFFEVDVALWKFVIAAIAAVIGARVFSHFLKNYRKRHANESPAPRKIS